MQSWKLAVSKDAKYVATGTHSGNINLYNTENGVREPVLETKGKLIMAVEYVLLIEISLLMDYCWPVGPKMERFTFSIPQLKNYFTLLLDTPWQSDQLCLHQIQST